MNLLNLRRNGIRKLDMFQFGDWLEGVPVPCCPVLELLALGENKMNLSDSLPGLLIYHVLCVRACMHGGWRKVRVVENGEQERGRERARWMWRRGVMMIELGGREGEGEGRGGQGIEGEEKDKSNPEGCCQAIPPNLAFEDRGCDLQGQWRPSSSLQPLPVLRL